MTPGFLFGFLAGVFVGAVLTIWLAIAPLERAARESDDA